MKKIITYIRETYYIENILHCVYCLAIVAAMFAGIRIYSNHERAKFAEERAKQKSEQICKTAEKHDIMKLQLDINAVNFAK